MEILKYLDTHEAQLCLLLIVTAVWGFLLGKWWAGIDAQTKTPPPPENNGIWW